MAITADSILAGYQPGYRFIKVATPTLVAARAHSLFYLAGKPGAAAVPSPGVNGASLTSYAGQLPTFDPNPGVTTLRMARLQAMATQAGTLMLCDRLWHNSGLDVTLTTLQSLDSGTLAARDNNGQANGVGVMAGLEVNSALGAGTPTWTLTYTDAANNPSHTATNIIPSAASSALGAFYEFGLAAGDAGIRKITGFQSNATATSGGFSLVLYRKIASLELSANLTGAIDFMTGGCPESWVSTVPFLIFVPTTTTASTIQGEVVWSLSAV